MNDPKSANETSNDASALHLQLLDYSKKIGAMRSDRVEAAFRDLPRHFFLPGKPLEEVYKDDAIVTKMDGEAPLSSSSQPTLMASMLEQLDLQPGHNVLEIGAGTGYNAALMAHIVGERGKVTTVDLDEDTVEGARAALARVGLSRVEVIHADGANGYLPSAPYDRIIVTVGPSEIPPAWREQLKPEGRLLSPLAIFNNGGFAGGQRIIAFERDALGLVSVSIEHGGFMPFRGVYPRMQPANGGRLQLGPEGNIHLHHQWDKAQEIDADAVYRLLQGPSESTPTGVKVTGHELGLRYVVWSELAGVTDEKRNLSFGLTVNGKAADRELVPYLFGLEGKFRSTDGVLRKGSLSLLSRAPELVPPATPPADNPVFELWVRSYGPDQSLAELLLEPLRRWDAAGRPPHEDKWRIKAYPLDAGYTPGPEEIVIDRQVTRIVIDLTGESTS